MALEARHHEVHRAFTGEEGYEKAGQLKPDLILLDMMLPTLNGLEVLKLLKADEELKAIPVIVVSAFYGEGAFTENAVLSQGAFDFMRKPVSLADLIARIASALAPAPQRLPPAKEKLPPAEFPPTPEDIPPAEGSLPQVPEYHPPEDDKLPPEEPGNPGA